VRDLRRDFFIVTMDFLGKETLGLGVGQPPIRRDLETYVLVT
jgi:hypothetical protein